MERATNVLGYLPLLVAVLVLALAGTLLRSLAVLTLLGFTVSFTAIVLGHITRHKIKKEEGQLEDRLTAIPGLALGYLTFVMALAFFLWLPYLNVFGAANANESSAIGSLRNIYLAAERYRENHPLAGFPEDLTQLTSSSNGSFDSQLAKGEKSGFRFTYIPHKKDGMVESYEAFADPTKENITGTKHFYVNQSGILRFAKKTKANIGSEAIQ